ncbi:hypothetical protein RRG08_045022 [Elysia crispata]|uniref:Uncharacterized protein n=1 Tax=Elysia crispata TaxID=231223 RepID=A0AAE1CS80_9GAST|nr:hypothetical protein RRG08_045022 [Elysia crispata]
MSKRSRHFYRYTSTPLEDENQQDSQDDFSLHDSLAARSLTPPGQTLTSFTTLGIRTFQTWLETSTQSLSHKTSPTSITASLKINTLYIHAPDLAFWWSDGVSCYQPYIKCGLVVWTSYPSLRLLDRMCLLLTSGPVIETNKEGSEGGRSRQAPRETLLYGQGPA